MKAGTDKQAAGEPGRQVGRLGRSNHSSVEKHLMAKVGVRRQAHFTSYLPGWQAGEYSIEV
jgi:hypothetical protein